MSTKPIPLFYIYFYTSWFSFMVSLRFRHTLISVSSDPPLSRRPFHLTYPFGYTLFQLPTQTNSPVFLPPSFPHSFPWLHVSSSILGTRRFTIERPESIVQVGYPSSCQDKILTPSLSNSRDGFWCLERPNLKRYRWPRVYWGFGHEWNIYDEVNAPCLRRSVGTLSFFVYTILFGTSHGPSQERLQCNKS